MKNTILLLSLFAGAALSAQQISDYRYVVVPANFADKNLNQYNLRKALISDITKKNYKVLTEDAASWPAEAQQNPCNVLKADVDDVSTMFRNKVRVTFQDCNSKKYSYDGMSPEKSFEIGYPEALAKAVQTVPVSTGSLVGFSSAAGNPVQTVNNSVKENVSQNTISEAPADNRVQNYYFGNLKMVRANVSDRQFIFTNPETFATYAVFTKSSKDGVFHVLLDDKRQALGYLENGNIIIEIPQANSEIVQQIFKRQN